MVKAVLHLLDYSSYFEVTETKLPSHKSGIIEKLKEEKFIIKKDSHYQIINLGAILFSKNINQFDSLERKAIRVVLYKGKNRIKTVKENIDNKGYAVSFSMLIDYINDQLPRKEEIGSAFRKETIVGQDQTLPKAWMQFILLLVYFI